MPSSDIRFTSYPQTEPPPEFVPEVVAVFRKHEASIATKRLAKGLTSDGVLAVLAHDLMTLGFAVETGKGRTAKIDRPVFFGENGVPVRRYQIDAYHNTWRCGLEVEAGRAWMGNAIYRDLIQAAVMVGIDHLCLAVSNEYRYNATGRGNTKASRQTVSPDYENAISVASTLFGHTRLRLPYGLTIIGY